MRGTLFTPQSARRSRLETAIRGQNLYTDQPATRNMGDGEENSWIRAIDGPVNRPIIGGSVGRNAQPRSRNPVSSRNDL